MKPFKATLTRIESKRKPYTWPSGYRSYEKVNEAVDYQVEVWQMDCNGFVYRSLDQPNLQKDQWDNKYLIGLKPNESD